MKIAGLALLASIFLSPASRAAEFRLLRAGDERLVSYTEDKITVVEVVGTGKDGWPELKSRTNFPSPESAATFLDSAFPDRVAIPEPYAAESTRDLRGNTPIWEVRNQWSWDWEIKFADWIRANVDADFFVKHQIATDCANVEYSFRWIFARANHLPMTSRLIGDAWFTEKSTRPEWEKLPTADDWSHDQRFLAALKYVLSTTYTHTLFADAYPVAIRPGAILEGGFQLDLWEGSGHTRPFTHVIRNGEDGLPIQVLMSTLPKQVRRLMADGYWISELPQKGKGGILRYRWPKAAKDGPGLIDAANMPNFSEEEYDPAFLSQGEPFFLAVFKRLKPDVNLKDLALGLVKSTKDAFLFRQGLVRDGFAFCAKNSCEPNGAGWEDWSTPTRDGRIGDQLQQVNVITMHLAGADRDAVKQEINAPFLEEDSWKLSLAELEWVWERRIYSSDPRVAPGARWAATPGGFRDALELRARAAWDAREKFIATTSGCDPAKCAPGSAGWKAQNSRALDQPLLELFPLTISYCGSFPADACHALSEKLAEKSALFGSLTVRDAFLKLLTINYDPRHSVDVRRNGLGDRFRMIPVHGDLSALVAGGDFLFDGGLDGPGSAIWNIQGEPKEVMHPAGARWLAADLKLRQAWFVTGAEVGFALLGGAAAQPRVTLSFVPSVADILGDGRAIFRNETDWAVVAFHDGQASVRAQGKADSIIKLEDAHYVFRHADHVELASFDGAGPMVTPLAIPLSEWDEGRPLAFSKSRLGWILRNSSSKGHHSYLVHRRLRSAIDITALMTDESEVMSDAAGNTMALIQYAHDHNTAKLVSFDDDGTLLKQDDLGKVQWARGGIVVLGDGPTYSLILVNGEFRKLLASRGEDYVEEADGDYVWAKSGKEYVLRKADGSQTLYRGDYAGHLVGAPNEAPGLIQLCDRGIADYHLYEVNCRLEDLQHPGDFSLLTGISQAGVYSARNSDGRVQRGFAVGIGGSAFWLERR